MRIMQKANGAERRSKRNISIEVPVDLKRRIERIAANDARSLSSYLRIVIERDAARREKSLGGARG